MPTFPLGLDLCYSTGGFVPPPSFPALLPSLPFTPLLVGPYSSFQTQLQSPSTTELAQHCIPHSSQSRYL